MAIRIKLPPPAMKAPVQPMPGAKHFDIILGLDFHLLKVPWIVTPCPITPFGALVFDPMDYIHITIPAMPAFSQEGKFSIQPAPMGGTVTINGFYRGGATTALLGLPPTMPPIPAKLKSAGAIAKKLSLLHLILPKPLFWLPFLAPHDGQISHGSQTVITQGLEQSTLMDPAWSCNELGKILMNNPTGLYNNYATRIIAVLPLGKPVIVGGARIEHKMGLADLANALIMMGLTKGGSKLLRKGLGKALTKLNAALSKKFPKFGKFAARVQPHICTHLGEPVDVARGAMDSLLQGFSLPGPIPFNWEANYYSDSLYEGAMGKSVIHNYDISLKILPEDNTVLINDSFGRGIAFPTLNPGESHFNTLEKYELHRHADSGEYFVSNKDGLYFYFYSYRDKDGLQPLRTIANRNGFAIRFQYNTSGHLQQIIDSAGRIILVLSNEAGLISSLEIPHPSGQGTFTPIRYEYDEEGRLITITDVEDLTNRLQWKNHFITARQFKDGTTFTFTYNKEEKCIAAEGPEGLFSYFFDYLPGHTIVTNSLGHQSHYYHHNGIVIRQVNPEGGEKTFTYDADRNLVAEQNEIGIVNTYEYDNTGNLIKKGLPGRGEIAVQYNNLHLPVKATLPNKAVWQYQYDESGNLLTSINPVGGWVKYSYNDGLLQSISGINNAVTELVYDTRYNLVQVSLSASRGAIRYQYDALGNCTKTTDPNRNEQVRRYDLKNRLIYLLEKDGNSHHFSYNANDDVIHASDNHTDVNMAYDFLGNITRRVQDGTQITFGYDTEGRLHSIENEHKEHYHFEYDGNGNMITEVGFDGLTRRYLRNLAGQAIEVERPGGKSIRYQYNNNGQVTNVLYTDGGVETYGYDALGALIQANNNTTEIGLQRDLFGRVIKEMQSDEHTVSSTYNQLGLRERITSSLGADIQVGYDKETGLATTLLAGGFKAEMNYNRNGQVTAKELNGGIRQKFEYDKIERLISQQVVQEKKSRHIRNYVWEPGYRLRKITDSEYGQKQFQRDVYGNLSEVIYGDGTTEYRMPDATGNLFETSSRTDRKYGKGGRLLNSKGTIYEYDAEGNLTRKIEKGNKVWQYNWNEAGMLESVLRPDETIVSFGYDALGRRIWKRYKSTITRWVWNGNVPLHEWKEFDARETTADDMITWIFEQNKFIPAGKLKGTKSYSIIADHLGTPSKVYSDNGSLIWDAELDKYGKLKVEKGEYGTCPFRYRGQYEDVETGLYYNRFRYYSAEEGIYISQDPIRLRGGMSLYSYVKDPSSFFDSLGLACEGDLGRHGVLKDDKEGGQSHHLNQNAAFRDVIPRNEGVAIKLEGNAFSEVGSNHYNAHQSMENFWDQYRKGGQLEGETPTIDDYNTALKQSLESTTLSPDQIDAAMHRAGLSQQEYGLNGTDNVPRIPGKINQAKP